VKIKKMLIKFSWKSEDKILERPGRRLEGFIKFDLIKKRVFEDVHWI